MPFPIIFRTLRARARKQTESSATGIKGNRARGKSEVSRWSFSQRIARVRNLREREQVPIAPAEDN
jgi:hypothetical protein